MRNTKFAINEFYHVYNRGTEKRDIFQDKQDVWRFWKYLTELNSVEVIGSLYQNSFRKKDQQKDKVQKLVNIIAYCLNQNHFHFILEPIEEDGIQKFMHRIGTGYTNYFNQKNKRTGALFQGTYKARHLYSNEDLLRIGVYVNLNDRIHDNLNKKWMQELPFSSYKEYIDSKCKGICKKDIILGQFDCTERFSMYCNEMLQILKKQKEDFKEI